MHLAQEAFVQRGADAPRIAMKLPPGEVVEIGNTER
jgi:hypothetical protein